MQPNEGRLQSAEHILAKILESKIEDVVIGISKFKEESGLLEITTKIDPRKLSGIEDEVNKIIQKEIPVHKTTVKREDADVPLTKVPDFVKELTIIDFEGFDKRPCRDPHVNNTKEIGQFSIIKLKKKGKDRYRFTFAVE